MCDTRAGESKVAEAKREVAEAEREVAEAEVRVAKMDESIAAFAVYKEKLRQELSLIEQQLVINASSSSSSAFEHNYKPFKVAYGPTGHRQLLTPRLVVSVDGKVASLMLSNFNTDDKYVGDICLASGTFAHALDFSLWTRAREAMHRIATDPTFEAYDTEVAELRKLGATLSDS